MSKEKVIEIKVIYVSYIVAKGNLNDESVLEKLLEFC